MHHVTACSASILSDITILIPLLLYISSGASKLSCYLYNVSYPWFLILCLEFNIQIYNERSGYLFSKNGAV